MATQLNLVAMLRMRGALHPLFHTSLCVMFKHRDSCTYTLISPKEHLIFISRDIEHVF
jgi:hypothetical protein